MSGFLLRFFFISPVCLFKRTRQIPLRFPIFCNCSEPSRFSCKSVNHACMNEHFYMEIYLADTPHRRNAQHFGGGSEQLPYFYYFTGGFLYNAKAMVLPRQKRTDMSSDIPSSRSHYQSLSLFSLLCIPAEHNLHLSCKYTAVFHQIIHKRYDRQNDSDPDQHLRCHIKCTAKIQNQQNDHQHL